MTRSPILLGMFCLLAFARASEADVYDAAVAHAGRSAADLKRDPLDHPADILRLSGIKPGMQVADVLAGDGYYSELASYVVGPKGRVFMINNAAFDHWSEGPLQARLDSNRLSNVELETLDLNRMNLKAGSLDAVFLIKVYHDLYWVDTEPNTPWPKMNPSVVLDQLTRVMALELGPHQRPGRATGSPDPVHRAAHRGDRR